MNEQNDLDLGSVRTWLDRHPPPPPTAGLLAHTQEVVRGEVRRVVRLAWIWRGLKGLGVAAMVAFAVLSWRGGTTSDIPASGSQEALLFVRAVEFEDVFVDADRAHLLRIASDLEHLENQADATDAREPWWQTLEEGTGSENAPGNML